MNKENYPRNRRQIDVLPAKRQKENPQDFCFVDEYIIQKNWKRIDDS